MRTAESSLLEDQTIEDQINQLFKNKNIDIYHSEFNQKLRKLIRKLKKPSTETILKIIKLDRRLGIFQSAKAQDIYYTLLKNISNDFKMILVKKHSDFILPLFKFIPKPTEKMKYLAVKKRCWEIGSIINPSEKLQILAVKQNPYSISYIKNPTEKVQNLCLNILKKGYWLHLGDLGKMICQSPNLSIMTIQRLALLVVKEKDIQAIKNHPNYIKDAELILKAINKVKD